MVHNLIHVAGFLNPFRVVPPFLTVPPSDPGQYLYMLYYNRIHVVRFFLAVMLRLY